MRQEIFFAIAAAVLFGASTPFAKQLLGEVHPLLLAGLLYLGSGLGLTSARAIRDGGWKSTGLSRTEWPWLLGAILFGGVLGPVALLFGLSRIDAGSASLLLNLESVLTALLAWIVFRENADRRIIAGMLLIVGGGAVLSWPYGGGTTASGSSMGQLLVAGACLCWAVDNNLTRKVSTVDSLFIAGSKGLMAGLTNTALALATGAQWPSLGVVTGALLLGLLGYGISLVFFVLALRGLGTARTGAYFSTAPFIGAAISLFWLSESASPAFWLAGALMIAGVWLHLTERHEHEHTHERLEHSHRHVHDEHHQHSHDDSIEDGVPHEHMHVHNPLTHQHAHFPDIHHQHRH
ncbi:DMT family transporter [Casimicrobium huifangae]|uniref:DMT family transporter n=1 Tax=Casimicrobium huifangae TaxID=2591109 RepID=UPI0012EC0B8A|nr:DMT family transporter [Casimicrobium huifangae]